MTFDKYIIVFDPAGGFYRIYKTYTDTKAKHHIENAGTHDKAVAVIDRLIRYGDRSHDNDLDLIEVYQPKDGDI